MYKNCVNCRAIFTLPSRKHSFQCPFPRARGFSRDFHQFVVKKERRKDFISKFLAIFSFFLIKKLIFSYIMRSFEAGEGSEECGGVGWVGAAHDRHKTKRKAVEVHPPTQLDNSPSRGTTNMYRLAAAFLSSPPPPPEHLSPASF
jgi:hypothetical protein